MSIQIYYNAALPSNETWISSNLQIRSPDLACPYAFACKAHQRWVLRYCHNSCNIKTRSSSKPRSPYTMLCCSSSFTVRVWRTAHTNWKTKLRTTKYFIGRKIITLTTNYIATTKNAFCLKRHPCPSPGKRPVSRSVSWCWTSSVSRPCKLSTLSHYSLIWTS